MSGAAGKTYLRTTPAERLPPPLARAGAIGWLRANLFSSPGNTVLTVLCVVFIAWVVPPLLRFFHHRRGVVSNGRDACVASAQQSGTRRLLGLCPGVVFLFRLRVLSDRIALAGRSVFHGAGIRRSVADLAAGAAPRHRRGLFLCRIAVPVVCAFKRCAAPRACQCDDRAVGRHPGDDRSGDRRHGGLAAARNPAGAGPTLRNAGRENLRNDFHRIRARRAIDHRAVHGERHAAAIRPGAFRAGQADAAR